MRDYGDYTMQLFKNLTETLFKETEDGKTR